MTDRQKTGIWFVVTGILLLTIYTLSYAIVNWSIDSGFMSLEWSNFSNEQRYVLGASGVLTLQLVSLTGIPFIVTGLAQIIIGMRKSKKSSKK